MEYYAKSPNAQGNQPTVKEHLQRVAEFAQMYGEPLKLGEVTKMIGQLHDFGKYTQAFQDVLKGIRTGVDHAMGGACFAEACYKGRLSSHPIAEAINGHHDGLVAYDEIKGELYAVADPKKTVHGNAGKAPAIAAKEQLLTANTAFRKDFPDFKPPKLPKPPEGELESML